MTTKEEKAELVAMAKLAHRIEEGLLMMGGRPVEEGAASKTEELQRIADLNIGDVGIIIEAEVLDIERSSGTNKQGEKYELAKVQLKDETGTLKVALWNEQLEHIENVNVGDTIRVKAWKAKAGHKTRNLELIYSSHGNIERLDAQRSL